MTTGNTRRDFLRLAGGATALLGGCAAGDFYIFTDDNEPIPPLSGGMDLSFFVASDTHFGAEGIYERNKKQVMAMNSLEGTALPPTIGGKVSRPRGVIITGDLTDNGRPGQWKQFVELYGHTGQDGMLNYPVYIQSGNHDRLTLWGSVLHGIRQRHGRLTYRWRWDDVQFISLDCYPNGFGRGYLKRQLKLIGPEHPVILLMHYSIIGPYSQWWSESEKKAFADVIKGYNIVSIFHGHFHWSGHYRWADTNIYNTGSPRHMVHSFGVVRITDNHLLFASWNWERNCWAWWRKQHLKPSTQKDIMHIEYSHGGIFNDQMLRKY